MEPAAETYQIDVRRDGTNQPWGFRLQGGIDFTTPLSIQSVAPGSPAERCGLRPADAIVQINGKETQGMEHDEAKREILMCADVVSMLVQRNAVQIWRPKVTPVAQMRPDQLQQVGGQPDPEQYVQRTSLAATKPESYEDIGVKFNRTARGFAGFGGGSAPAPAPAQSQAQPQVQPSQPPYGGGYDQSAGQYAGYAQQQQQPPPAGSPGGYGQLQQYGAPPPQQFGGGFNSNAQSQSFTPQPQTPAAQPSQPAGGSLGGMRSVRAPVFDAEHHAKMQEKHLQHHPDCKVCGKSIVGVFVRIKGHPMHPECFKCVRCGLNLKQQGHFEIDEGLVCERCYS